MSLTRQQKETQVADLTKVLSQAVSAVWWSFDGMTVTDVEKLRQQLHAKGAHMRVMPKRLFKLVAANIKQDFDPTQHDGQFACVWGSDVISPAQLVYRFAKGKEKILLLGGMMEGSALNQAEVQALAQLPGRDELLGKLVGTLAGPLRGLANVLSGVQRQTVYVLSAIAEQKQGA